MVQQWLLRLKSIAIGYNYLYGVYITNMYVR